FHFSKKFGFVCIKFYEQFPLEAVFFNDFAQVEAILLLHRFKIYASFSSSAASTSVAGVSSVAVSATSASTSASSVTSSAGALAAAASAARLSLTAFSAASFSAFAFSLASERDAFLWSIEPDFCSNHSLNFASACSSVKAPLRTPPARWFFIKAPL